MICAIHDEDWKFIADIMKNKDQAYLRSSDNYIMIKNSKNDNNNKVKDDDAKTAPDLSLHSEEIKENLNNVNMDPWFYIYENYVNPNPKKSKDQL